MILAVGLADCAALAQVRAVGRVRRIVNAAPEAEEPSPETQAVLPLVNTDEELDEYLHQAEQYIADKQYDKAIEILQALITSGKRVFHRPAGTSRRFVSIRAAATEALGKMTPEGLDLYRRLYDPQAARLLEEAQRSGDVALFGRIVDEYYHTRYGPQALDRLAAIAFDRGDFLQAARAWESAAAAARPEPGTRATRLAKGAVAWHLGGESRKASDLLAVLKREHAAAEGPIAGRPENLVAFVERAMASPPPSFAAAPPVGSDSWPSLAGAPSGIAVGAACEAALFPLWRQPQDSQRREAMIRSLLGVSSSNAMPEEMQFRGRLPGLKMDLRDGQVRISSLWPGQPRLMFALAPVMHPVVVKDLVICRDYDEVIACDIATGQRAWQTSGLGMYRNLSGPYFNSGYPFQQFAPMMGDTGRYTLTVGADKVFTVGGFLPGIMSRLALMGWQPPQPGAKRPSDGSTLAAVSVSAQGKILWKVGNGAGDSEVVREGKFLSAPTYADGRLYAIVLYLHSYHAVCLDPESGATVWETCFGQEPSSSGEGNPFQMLAPLVTERGSPPAVSDGRVFLTSNAGLVAALSADTGQPLWTYQYSSLLSQPFDGRANQRLMRLFQGDLEAGGTLYPANPLLAARGRVICLPSDSDEVLALSADAGDLLWKAKRRDQHDLTGIDNDRLLLSGKDLLILRTKDGSVLKAVPDTGPLLGRPAVAGNAVMASGKGQLVRVDLATYGVSHHPILREECVLGSLVSAGGRLVAANAAGLSAYFAYDDAWQRLGQRLAQTDQPAAKFEVHLARGQFAIVAGRLDQADTEFQAAGALAAETKDEKALAAVRPWLYRLALRRANQTDTDARLGQLLDEADKYCFNPQTEAEMLVRRLRWHERFGRYVEAAEQAQRLSEKPAGVRLRDVSLGPEADPIDNLADGRPLQSGYQLGQRHVARLIEKHGKDTYSKFDAEARQALDLGLATSDVDTMLAAQQRYPHSACAGGLLLAAAEILYTRAKGAAAPDGDVLNRADRVLGELRNCTDSTLAARARAARALVAEALDPALAARFHADLARDAPATPVDFGDFHGTLAELAARISAAGSAPPDRRPPASHLSPPLDEVYRVRDERVMVLRDPDRRPLRLGPRLFLYGENRVICLDTQANDFAAGVLWTAQVGSDDSRRVGYLTDDLRHLAVLDNEGLSLIATTGGKLVYRKNLNKLGIDNWTSLVGHGNNLIIAQYQGKLRCISLDKGDVLWQTPNQKNPNGTFLDVRSDTVVAQDQGMQESRVFDARSGKLLMEVRSPQSRLEMAPTADGLALVVRDNTVALFDPRRAGRGPLWQATLPDRRLTMLGVGDRHAAVGGQETRNTYVLDLTAGGRVAVQVPAPRLKNKVYMATQAVFDGSRMYLVCGTASSGMEFDMIRRFTNVMAPAIQAVDLASGKPLWMTPVSTNERSYVGVEDPILQGRHVALLMRPNDFRETCGWFVLAKDTGEIVGGGATTPEDVAQTNAEFFQMRRQIIGHPIITNGRLLAEDDAGLLLLRSPL